MKSKLKSALMQMKMMRNYKIMHIIFKISKWSNDEHDGIMKMKITMKMNKIWKVKNMTLANMKNMVKWWTRCELWAWRNDDNKDQDANADNDENDDNDKQLRIIF